MRKTRKEITKDLTTNLFYYTQQSGVFCCSEVTIGIGGSERVDYLTYDTKGVFRCYEIKSSKEDFYSDAKWSFVGHYNYFVLTKELYEQVKHDIPSYVGVISNGSASIKRAKRQNNINVESLKDSLIRSLSREFRKSFLSENVNYMQRIESHNNRLINENKKLHRDKQIVNNIIYMIKNETSMDKIKEYLNMTDL